MIENLNVCLLYTSIQIIKGANSYLEIKRIAEEIKKHYVQGIELKDMGIVLANSQEYKNILFQVFEEEKIPCTLSRDINLMEIPLIKEVLYLLKLKENPRENSNIINRIKCNYIKLCEDEEREAIEYISVSYTHLDVYKRQSYGY